MIHKAALPAVQCTHLQSCVVWKWSLWSDHFEVFIYKSYNTHTPQHYTTLSWPHCTSPDLVLLTTIKWIKFQHKWKTRSQSKIWIHHGSAVKKTFRDALHEQVHELITCHELIMTTPDAERWWWQNFSINIHRMMIMMTCLLPSPLESTDLSEVELRRFEILTSRESELSNFQTKWQCDKPTKTKCR